MHKKQQTRAFHRRLQLLPAQLWLPLLSRLFPYLPI